MSERELKDFVAATANVLQIIASFDELKMPLDLRKLRAGANCQAAAAAVAKFQADHAEAGRTWAPAAAPVTAEDRLFALGQTVNALLFENAELRAVLAGLLAVFDATAPDTGRAQERAAAVLKKERVVPA